MKKSLLSLMAVPLLMTSCSTTPYQAMTCKRDGTAAENFSKDEVVRFALLSKVPLPKEELRCEVDKYVTFTAADNKLVTNVEHLFTQYPNGIEQTVSTNFYPYTNVYYFTFNPKTSKNSANLNEGAGTWYSVKEMKGLKKGFINLFGGMCEAFIMQNDYDDKDSEEKSLGASVFYRK